MRKEFECDRDRWIGIWKSDPLSNCVKRKNMKHHAAVQALSSQMQIDYGVNLKYVSSDALRPYMVLSDKTDKKKSIKQAVFELIIKAIKEDKNPLTGIPFGDNDFGLTEEMVQSFIRYIRTGRRAASPRKHVKLWQGDIHLLDILVEAVSKNGYDPTVKKLAESLRVRIHRGDFAPEKATT